VTIRFVELAEAELDDAIHYYESEAPGLGTNFSPRSSWQENG